MPFEKDDTFMGGERATSQARSKSNERRELLHEGESEQEEVVDTGERNDSFTPQIKEIADIKQRLDVIESDVTGKLPIAPLTPSSDLDDIKHTINKMINYVNIGVRGG